MRLRRVVFITPVFLFVVYGIYLFLNYGQLKEAFEHQVEFVPTRIYSDISKIAPPQPREFVEQRLKALAYNYNASGESITFTLHPLEYPIYLLPDSHPTIEAFNKQLTLTFAGDTGDAALTAIELNGTEIPEIYLEPEIVATLSRSGAAPKQIRQALSFKDIPAQVWQAIIAIEDQHFLEHSGLDPRGIARAVWVNLRTLSLAQGGSTITQQLVKNLMARRGKNLLKKISEVFLALILEATHEKEQILERYLNEVYLGQVGSYEVHGVAEGARYFFGKEVGELNLAETALMAGLIRGPAYYSPYKYRDRAVERQRLVLKKMVETGQIAETEEQQAMAMPIRLAPPQTVSNKAPYFADFAKAELLKQLKDKVTEQELPEAGFRVYTTLDLAMNSAAQETVAKGVVELEQRLGVSEDQLLKLEGALASVDHSTGFVRALVGGRSYSYSTFNRILNMKRQVGSTFKPIVYLTALLKGYDPNDIPYSPAHPTEDSPWTLNYDNQTWSPRNYEKEFRGFTNFRTALAHSINTSAAQLAWEVGINRVIATARNVGIESYLPEVPSLSLGVAELSPMELLKAYSIFANHGVQDQLTVIRAITRDDGTNFARFVYHPKEVLEPAAADLLTDMLQSVFIEGTARGQSARAGFDRPAAGKTGTTSDHRDAWFAGYTPQLTTVVWVGMDQYAPAVPGVETKKIILTGGGSALPIWLNFMKRALASEPPLTFPLNPNLVEMAVDQYTGQSAAPGCPTGQVITDKFIKGREPKTTTCDPKWPDPRPAPSPVLGPASVSE